MAVGIQASRSELGPEYGPGAGRGEPGGSGAPGVAMATRGCPSFSPASARLQVPNGRGLVLRRLPGSEDRAGRGVSPGFGEQSGTGDDFPGSGVAEGSDSGFGLGVRRGGRERGSEAAQDPG